MKNKRRSDKLWVEIDLLKSEAYWKLSGTALKILGIFFIKRQMEEVKIGKRKGWKIVNNGEIYFTYSEAKEKYGVSGSSFSRAIQELVDVGIMDIYQQGIGYKRISSLYGFSERWKKFGKSDFEKGKREKRHSYRFKKK